MENSIMDLTLTEHTGAKVEPRQQGIGVFEASQLRVMIDELYSGDFDFPKNFGFYHYLSSLYADVEAINVAFYKAYHKTIEQYRLEYRINKVKEFLVYTDLSLTEIAHKLDFEHPDHLLNMLKQQTGLSPAFFKQIKRQKDALMRSLT